MNIAIIGTGHIAHYHAKAIQEIPAARLVAVFSNNAERAAEFSKLYGIRGYSNFSDLLKVSELEVLDITNANYLHGDFAIKGIQGKKHIIIEKPIDISVEKGELIVREAQKNNVAITVISQYRFGKDIRNIKTQIDNGKLGKPIMAIVRIGKCRGQEYYDANGGWRKKKNLAGGGVIMINAIHYVNILRWLFGEVKSVTGEISTLTHKMDVEDTGVMIMKFDNDALGVIAATTSLNSEVPDRIEVYGSKSSVIIESEQIVSKYFGIFHLWSLILAKMGINRKGTLKCQIENFIGYLNHRGSLEISGEDGLEDIRVISNFYK